jgi:hypothetical protein
MHITNALALPPKAEDFFFPFSSLGRDKHYGLGWFLLGTLATESNYV